MKALLEDAPIGTIHSFFSKIITPFLSYLGESTKSQIIENYASQAIQKKPSIYSGKSRRTRSFHRIAFRIHAAIKQLISRSCDRLTRHIRVDDADNVLSNLIKKSIFVEEASNRLTENGHITTQKLLDEVYSWVAPEQMSSLIETLFENIRDVMETIRKYSHIIAPNGWKIEDRVGILDHLSKYKPANIEEEIEWLSKLTILSRSKPSNSFRMAAFQIQKNGKLNPHVVCYGSSEEVKRAKEEMKFA